MATQGDGRRSRWGKREIEVKEDHEWMKCANCGTFSRRPLSGGDWEPHYESREPPAQF